MANYNLNNPPEGYIVHTTDKTQVHSGYNSRTAPKIYMSKGRAQAAANQRNGRGRHWDYTLRKYVDNPGTNKWMVSPAHIALTPDPLETSIRDFVKKTAHSGVTVNDAVAEILNIIRSTAKN